MTGPTPEKARLVGLLAKVPLFSGLDEKELMDIVAVGSEVSFAPGKAILKQGEPGLSFLLVLEGKVEVRKGEKVIAETGPGGFFGEMTVFDDKPRSADIVAVEPTRCFGITNWSFIPMLRSNPSVAIGIINELVRRLRQLEDKPTN
ncbi:MAG TPA: cyclic nucleotide-binding domain-containing protein [Nitrososphaerales archaeon]|nr:cyclic nucleotide-binding domain-containing protein [Nitrososphaerales archaeon]